MSEFQKQNFEKLLNEVQSENQVKGRILGFAFFAFGLLLFLWIWFYAKQHWNPIRGIEFSASCGLYFGIGILVFFENEFWKKRGLFRVFLLIWLFVVIAILAVYVFWFIHGS
jgi:hypothetical protein